MKVYVLTVKTDLCLKNLIYLKPSDAIKVFREKIQHEVGVGTDAELEALATNHYTFLDEGEMWLKGVEVIEK